MECIILIGIPGCGKSTFYKDKYGDTHLRINLDMLGRRNRESAIFEIAVKTKTKIVIDNTNVTIENRKKYIPLLKANSYKIIACYWDPHCLNYNEKRENPVPKEAIRKYIKEFIIPTFDEGFNKINRVN